MLGTAKTQMIALRTFEIQSEEAKPGEWDGELLKALYAQRLSLITEALAEGTTPGYLSYVTGLGANV